MVSYQKVASSFASFENALLGSSCYKALYAGYFFTKIAALECVEKSREMTLFAIRHKTQIVAGLSLAFFAYALGCSLGGQVNKHLYGEWVSELEGAIKSTNPAILEKANYLEQRAQLYRRLDRLLRLTHRQMDRICWGADRELGVTPDICEMRGWF